VIIGIFAKVALELQAVPFLVIKWLRSTLVVSYSPLC